MQRVAIGIYLCFLSLFSVRSSSLANDVFPIPHGWTERRIDPKAIERAIATAGYTPPERDFHLFVAPSRVDGFLANIVVDIADQPIDRQMADYRRFMSRLGRRFVDDRPLSCRRGLRGQLFEDTSVGRDGRSIDAMQLEIGHPNAVESVSVTYTRRGGTPVDPDARRTLLWLCDAPAGSHP